MTIKKIFLLSHITSINSNEKNIEQTKIKLYCSIENKLDLVLMAIILANNVRIGQIVEIIISIIIV